MDAEWEIAQLVDQLAAVLLLRHPGVPQLEAQLLQGQVQGQRSDVQASPSASGISSELAVAPGYEERAAG